MTEITEPASTGTGGSKGTGSQGSGDGQPTTGRKATTWWRWGLGLGLLAILVGVIGPGRLAQTLVRMDPVLAVGLVGLSLVWLGVAALNVWIVLRRLNPVPLGTFLPVYGTSWAVAQLLPGQLGDASQVLLLRNHDVPAGQSGAAYLIDKAMSFAWMALVALYGAFRYLPGLGDQVAPWLLVLASIFGLVFGVVAIWAAMRLPARNGGLVFRLQALLRRTLTELRRMRKHPGTLALNLTLTLLKWVILTLLYVGAFRAFGETIALEAAATLPVMSSLVGYLPITVGGAGTIELSGIYLFGRLGVDSATVLAVYLFFRVELLVIALLLALFGGRRRHYPSVPA